MCFHNRIKSYLKPNHNFQVSFPVLIFLRITGKKSSIFCMYII
uniref:Uncharacterized protein n=1 Tax=Anguilla anguilla TaxID=7936 RepID=A0A0E9VB19_ANGAN